MSIRSIVPTARSGQTGKIVSAREAVRLIRDGDTVAIGGFIGIGLALEVVHELAALSAATDGVTRFTTSSFMRAKLGRALESRGVAPHIYQSEGEAAGAIRATLARQE